jgi:membrane protein DedA with SNARE-associated domain
MPILRSCFLSEAFLIQLQNWIRAGNHYGSWTRKSSATEALNSCEFSYEWQIERRTKRVPWDPRAFWVYLATLATLLGASLGLPIPEEIPIVTAGAVTGHPDSAVRWWIMLPVLIVGVVTGDGILYFIGYRWGNRLLRNTWVRRRLLPIDRQQRIEKRIERYGIWILLGARLTPGLRSPIFLMAGSHRLPFIKFLIADGIYAVPGVSLLFWLAYFFTDQVTELIGPFEKWRPIIVLIVLSAVALYLIRFFLKHPVTEGDPKDVPIIGRQVASHYEKQPGENNRPEAEKGQPNSTPARNA